MMIQAQEVVKKIFVTPDSKKLGELLDGLFTELSKASDDVRKLALEFIEITPELFSFEYSIASRAAITVLFKPSQRLIDLEFAIRTGNLDSLVINRSHGSSFVDNGLVELPILSTSEELSNKAECGNAKMQLTKEKKES